MKFRNLRLLNAHINDKLHNIGTRDISQTWGYAFYDVLYNENGGIWKLLQDKNTGEYIEIVSNDNNILAEVHYRVIDEHNGTLETTMMLFKQG